MTEESVLTCNNSIHLIEMTCTTYIIIIGKTLLSKSSTSLPINTSHSKIITFRSPTNQGSLQSLNHTSELRQSILLYGKLRERAVCGEFCVLIGYPSGQDGAILPARDCPFRSRK